MSIELKPEEVRAKFGRLFSRNFMTLVDEDAGLVEIIEECSARGPAEWDAVNRLRAGGVTRDAWVEGNTIHMITRIGNKPVSFGPADAETGGQALEGVEVKGDTVTTHWAGIAGAGVGISACLAQSPGVIKAVYPSSEDIERVGGAHTCRVSILTPKLEKVVIGVDDTDNKERGATWLTAFKIGREAPAGKLLAHRIVQLYPRVKHKTTNCVSTALVFATSDADALITYVKKRFSELTVSDETHIAIWRGIAIPAELKDFGRRVKTEEVKMEDAIGLVSKFGIEHYTITGERGLIGALAAVGYSDSGLEAAGLPDT